MPTLDEELLPVSPLDAPGARLDVPVLVGTTRDEATFLFRTGGRDAPDEQVERVTAHLFREPTERWARERAAAGGRVHLFRVDHPSPDPRLGALHTIDVPLLFGTFGEVGSHYVADDERTREVSRGMQREWGRFLHGEELAWDGLRVSADLHNRRKCIHLRDGGAATSRVDRGRRAERALPRPGPAPRRRLVRRLRA